MGIVDDFARVRVEPPSEEYGNRLRACDVLVSSDGGETWKPLPVYSSVLSSSADTRPKIELSMQYIPGIVDVFGQGEEK